MSRGLDDVPSPAGTGGTGGAMPGPSGGVPATPSNGSGITVRGLKTLGFIGVEEKSKRILRQFEHVSGGNVRPWCKTVYTARVQSAAPVQWSLFDDNLNTTPLPIPATDLRVHGLNILKEENVEPLQVAVQSNIIILDMSPDTVRTTLRQGGMAIALAGKVLVSLAIGVTIAEMYDALYSGNDSPDLAPVEGSEQCFITRARPVFSTPVVGSPTSTLLVPPSRDRAPRPSQAQVGLVESFFSKIGSTREVDETETDSEI